ncbi:MAG: type II toxin-antitoxin system RelE/ParE family toxin [Candidatus Omnitrophica bacterium]|nr:type II toxin-antitoxin system RelE/ParE family toxin [Candidatus Omnitrophota bacterium]
MTRNLEYLQEALEEAEEATRWYAERSPTTAAAFTNELDVAAAAVEQAPQAWPPYDHGTRRFLLRRFPYFLVYRIEPTRVVIVAVAHAHRRPGYWKDRLRVQG